MVDELLEGEDDRLGELVAEDDKLPVPEAEELPLAEELRLGESDMLKEGDREELRVTELDGEAVGVSVFEPVGDSLLVVEDVVVGVYVCEEVHEGVVVGVAVLPHPSTDSILE